MGATTSQSSWQRALELVRKQHGAVSRQQLLALGFSGKAIKHSVSAARLHKTEFRGVYVLGRPELTQYGRLGAALLSCGEDATLVGDTAGGLWDIWKPRDRRVHLSLPAVQQRRSRNGVVVHRRNLPRSEITHQRGLRVTTPLRTVIDLSAQCRTDREAERLVNQADARNLIRADVLLEALGAHAGEPGVPLLMKLLTRDSFVLTDSELERLILPLFERAGLPKPQSQRRFGPHRVDFYFPELNLVVEVDSLRYHRTTLQQREDRRRDHGHVLDRRNRERFTFHEVAHEPDHVVAVLAERRRMHGYTRGR